ncbi:MAG: RNA methyltransferase [Paludibacteraceae bacterium]|nr:RNA methyltransferase [Paludibacteraceae bacterium]
MADKRAFKMVAKTFKGLEEVLAQELTELGADEVQIQRRAVSFSGDKAMLYSANLWLRTALRVLVPVKSERLKVKGERRPEDQLYDIVKGINWAKYMTAETSFAIDATAYSDSLRNSRFVTYRVKDAIVDYWQEREGRRPNVQVTDPDLRINVHVGGEQVTVSLDSSGESLHKRGYRVATTEAPLSEVLAAGMLLLAGWQGQSDLYDPMCGSGTIPIEAALIALNIPPGVFRKEFAFERWQDFDAELWEEIYNDDSRERAFTHTIYASDASFYAIQQAEKNIKSAGVAKYVNLRQVRMEERRASAGENAMQGALVLLNPPYGERLAQQKDMLQLYGAIGTTLKHQFAGATAWIISSNDEAMKQIGLKPSRKMRLLNGELDCQFNKYELFQGKRKDNNQ